MSRNRGVHLTGIDRFAPVAFLRTASPRDYGGLCDAMFHKIRQNAAGSVPVLGRILARAAMFELRRDVPDPSDPADLEGRYRRLRGVPAGGLLAPSSGTMRRVRQGVAGAARASGSGSTAGGVGRGQPQHHRPGGHAG